MRDDLNWFEESWVPDAVKTVLALLIWWLVVCTALGVTIGVVWGVARWIMGAH